MSDRKRPQEKSRLLNVLLHDVVLSIDLPRQREDERSECVAESIAPHPVETAARTRPQHSRPDSARDGNNACYRVALELASHGFSLCSIGGRHADPCEEGYFGDIIVTPDDVRRWFEIDPDSNLAVPTGEEFGVLGLVAGREAIRNGSLNVLRGLVPPTPLKWIASSGARFLLLRYPAGGRLRPGPIPGLPGVRIVADGDVVTVPPSHDRWNGRYEWARESGPAPRESLVEIPPGLMRLLVPLMKSSATETASDGAGGVA